MIYISNTIGIQRGGKQHAQIYSGQLHLVGDPSITIELLPQQCSTKKIAGGITHNG